MLKRFPGIELLLAFRLAMACALIPASAFAEEPDQRSEGAEAAKSQEAPNPKPPPRLQKILGAQVSPPATSESYVDEPYGSSEPAHQHEISPKAHEREPEKSDLEGAAEAIDEEAEAAKQALKRLEEALKKRKAEEATRQSDQPQEIGEE